MNNIQQRNKAPSQNFFEQDRQSQQIILQQQPVVTQTPQQQTITRTNEYQYTYTQNQPNYRNFEDGSYKPPASVVYEQKTVNIVDDDGDKVKRAGKKQTHITTTEVQDVTYTGVTVKQIQQPQHPVSTQYQNDLKSEMDIYLFSYNNQDGEQNYAHDIQRLKKESQNVSACNIF